MALPPANLLANIPRMGEEDGTSAYWVTATHTEDALLGSWIQHELTMGNEPTKGRRTDTAATRSLHPQNLIQS